MSDRKESKKEKRQEKGRRQQLQWQEQRERERERNRSDTKRYKKQKVTKKRDGSISGQRMERRDPSRSKTWFSFHSSSCHSFYFSCEDKKKSSQDGHFALTQTLCLWLWFLESSSSKNREGILVFSLIRLRRPFSAWQKHLLLFHCILSFSPTSSSLLHSLQWLFFLPWLALLPVTVRCPSPFSLFSFWSFLLYLSFLFTQQTLDSWGRSWSKSLDVLWHKSKTLGQKIRRGGSQKETALEGQKRRRHETDKSQWRRKVKKETKEGKWGKG